MKKVLTHVLTVLALIMTFGLTAYAGHIKIVQHEGTDATNAAATQAVAGHPQLQKEGHPN